MTDIEKAAAEKAATEAKALQDKATADAIAALTESNKVLGGQVKEIADKLAARTTAPEQKSINDAAKAFTATIEALLEDKSLSPEVVNGELTKLAGVVQDAFSKVTGVKPDPKAAAKVDAMTASANASKLLADSLSTMTSADAKKTLENSMVAVLDKAIPEIGAKDFADADRKKLRDSLETRVRACTSEEQVKQLIEDSLDMMNVGRVAERLIQRGYKEPSGNPGRAAQEPAVTDTKTIDDKTGGPRIELEDKGFLQGVAFLQDKARETGSFHPMLNMRNQRTIEGNKDVHPGLKKVMDAWDKKNGHKLQAELDGMLKAGGGRLNDAALHADFETPITLTRLVLFEAYADDIILGITKFGTMENDRDSIPITRWRRESDNSKTYQPSVRNRAELRVPEMTAMPKAKLITEFFNIEASARKLQATMSDEFITRAKRRPDITGVAMSAQNLVADMRRSLQQDIFWEMIRAALSNGAVTFSSTQTGNSILTVFQVTSATNQAGDPITIDLEDAQSIVPGSLSVEINSITVPEYGTQTTGGGPGAAYFFIADFAAGTVAFVNAAGVAFAPGAFAVDVTGRKASGSTAGTRFDMTAPTSPAVTQPDWMDRLLFSIQNLSAAMSENTGFSPDLLLANRTNSTFMTQARTYEKQAARRAYAGDGPIIDGNFGRTADLSHFASRVFPSNFALIALQEATSYRVFEPLSLQGPEQARDTNGNLIGGKEWFASQEDSVAVPLSEKLGIITLYQS